MSDDSPTSPAAAPPPKPTTVSAKSQATDTDAADSSAGSRRGPGMNLAAAVLGWALPGLGHLALGHTARGLILAVTIGSLWLGGLLIGGVSVIDRRDHPGWFIGQMMIAPSWVVDRYHDHLRQAWNQRVGTEPNVDRGFVPAHGKPEEQGTLYIWLAGLLNLLAIIDALYRPPASAADSEAYASSNGGVFT
ncbi:MAG: DUF6677 family protein [Planctomycetota bacterium]